MVGQAVRPRHEVCGRSAAAQEIARQVEAGKLTKGRASSLLGAVTAWDEALRPKLYYGGDQQAANQLRKAGIAFSRAMPPQACVHLAEVLRVAASAWTTGGPAR